MIIDFHTHAFPDKLAGAAVSELEARSGLTAAFDGTVSGLLASMDRAGIDKSVLLPVVTSPKQFSGINRFAAAVNERYADRLVSFGGIHPDSPDIRGELTSLKNMGFRGIKLHPDYQGVCFDDIRYMRIVSTACELGLWVSVHAGVDIGLSKKVHCTPEMSARVLSETQADNLILAHMGGWQLWETVEELLAGKRVYLDTSFVQAYMEQEQFLRILAGHGAERILFATDCPWTDQSFAVSWLSGLPVPAETRELIAWGNAERLLETGF